MFHYGFFRRTHKALFIVCLSLFFVFSLSFVPRACATSTVEENGWKVLYAWNCVGGWNNPNNADAFEAYGTTGGQTTYFRIGHKSLNNVDQGGTNNQNDYSLCYVQYKNSLNPNYPGHVNGDPSQHGLQAKDADDIALHAIGTGKQVTSHEYTNYSDTNSHSVDSYDTGGCIGLSEKNAKTLYNLSGIIGTYVCQYTESKAYKNPSGPGVNARGATQSVKTYSGLTVQSSNITTRGTRSNGQPLYVYRDSTLNVEDTPSWAGDTDYLRSMIHFVTDKYEDHNGFVAENYTGEYFIVQDYDFARIIVLQRTNTTQEQIKTSAQPICHPKITYTSGSTAMVSWTGNLTAISSSANAFRYGFYKIGYKCSDGTTKWSAWVSPKFGQSVQYQQIVGYDTSMSKPIICIQFWQNSNTSLRPYCDEEEQIQVTKKSNYTPHPTVSRTTLRTLTITTGKFCSSGNSKVTITYSTDKNFSWSQTVTGNTSSPVPIKNLNPNTTYYYKIAYRGEYGEYYVTPTCSARTLSQVNRIKPKAEDTHIIFYPAYDSNNDTSKEYAYVRVKCKKKVSDAQPFSDIKYPSGWCTNDGGAVITVTGINPNEAYDYYYEYSSDKQNITHSFYAGSVNADNVSFSGTVFWYQTKYLVGGARQYTFYDFNVSGYRNSGINTNIDHINLSYGTTAKNSVPGLAQGYISLYERNKGQQRGSFTVGLGQGYYIWYTIVYVDGAKYTTRPERYYFNGGFQPSRLIG